MGAEEDNKIFADTNHVYYIKNNQGSYICLGSGETIYVDYAGDMPTGELEFRNNTKIIAERAFQNCVDLTSVIIPNFITSIGNNVFQECTELTQIKLKDFQDFDDYDL
jgi:hypothetical protein